MGVAAAIVGAGALGAGATIIGSSNAANAQTNAANAAIAAQQGMFNTTQANLGPYNQTGQNALSQALGMASNGFNFNPTMDQLTKTPGYQFNLAQGLNAVQNSAAARGLGSSGAAMRGAADYASGLASNTYQQQFQNALTQYQTNYQNLAGLAGLGENAAAGVGNAATATGQGIANSLIGAGNAQAAASMAQGNAINNGLGNLSALAFLNKMNGGGNSLTGANAAWSGYNVTGLPSNYVDA